MSGKKGLGFDIHDAEAFKLRHLSKLKFHLEPRTVADLSVAESAIWDFNRKELAEANPTYADAMLNIEALASVRMDGRPPSARDIFFEDVVARCKGLEPSDHVLRFRRDRESLVFALERAESKVTLETFCDVHKRVLPPKHDVTGGILRSGMQQVGGSRYHVFGSVYTMPSPADIPALMDDLAAFLNDESIPTVEQAGIAHAQLINIHPFDRGNGKMSRMMVHHALRHRGIASYMLVPFTTVVVTSSHDYIAGIDGCKFEEGVSRDEASKRMNEWLHYFSKSCLQAVKISGDFISACEGTLSEARALAKTRKGSTAQMLIDLLPAMPVFTARMVEERCGCSFKRASEACKVLEESGAIQLQGASKRNRVYCSEGVLNAYMSIEALK